MKISSIPKLAILSVALMASLTSNAAEPQLLDARVLCMGGIINIFPLDQNQASVVRYAPEDFKENDKGGFSMKGLAIKLFQEESEASKKNYYLPGGLRKYNPNYSVVYEYSAEIEGRISLYCTSGTILPMKEIKLGKSATAPERRKE